MRTLYTTKKKKDSHLIKEKFFVLDVETDGLQATPDKFIFGCIYGYHYKKVFYSVDDIKKELTTVKFRHKTIFAHNAFFDFETVYGNILQNLDSKAIFNGGSFICARRGLVRYADSLNLFRTSVKAIGMSIGLEKLELPEKFKTGKVKDITDTDIEYCFRDCEIVYKALLTLFETVGSIKPTIAGCALTMYRNFYQPFHITYNEKLSDKFFDSYYGGRVECFKIGETSSTKYDVNSMYPYSMVYCKFPNPRYLKEIKKVSLKKFSYYLSNFEGLATVTLTHKHSSFGFLPYRSNGKLLFPSGTFTGTYNFIELRYALEKNIIEVLKIDSIIFSPPMTSPFIDFVNDLYLKRQKSDGVYNFIYKNLLNNLYGKFAQRIKLQTEYFENDPKEKILELTIKGIPFQCIPVNKVKGFYLHTPCNKTNLHTIALFSSYITSFARVHLLKHLSRFEKNRLVYVDTDCIALENKLVNHSDTLELGGFKIEKETITEVYGNKSYKYEYNTEVNKKLKGIPRTAIEVRPFEFNYTKLIKTKEGLKRNIQSGTPVQITKILKFNYDKRETKKSGFTRILHLSS